MTTPQQIVAALRAEAAIYEIATPGDAGRYDAADLASLLRQAADLIEAREWRSMDSAPKDGTHILLFQDGWITIGFFVCSAGIYESIDGDIEKQPGCWQPLPEAPR